MPSTSDVLLLVGRLNYAWTNTESLLIYVIAHLLDVGKEKAVIVFLTLNTTRARIDLVERLAKLPGAKRDEAKRVLALTGKLKKLSKVRNKYNHCIYAFDEKGEISSTQLMRLVEDGTSVKYGMVEPIDDGEMARLEQSIRDIGEISRDFWTFIRESPRSAPDF